jgi:hypothetical protein
MTVNALKSALLGALMGYAVAAFGAIVGLAGRMAFNTQRPPPVYHCYVWESRVATALVVYLLAAPLAVVFIQGRARATAIVVVGLLALVLATFVMSYTRVLPCSPL